MPLPPGLATRAGLAVAIAFAATLAGALLIQTPRSTTETPSQASMRIVSELEPLDVLESPPHGRTAVPAELLRESSLLPTSGTPERPALHELFQYAQTCAPLPQAVPSQLEKTLTWERYLCGDLAELPDGFFEAPPYIHPGGGSFVERALSSGKPAFQSPSFLEQQAKHLHVRESLNRGLAGRSRFLAWFSSFSPDESDAFLSSASLVAGTRVVALVSPDTLHRTLVFRREDWDAALAALGWKTVPTPIRDSCTRREGNACWIRLEKPSSPHSARWALAAGTFSGVLALSLLLFYALERRRIIRDREFSLRVLTHELRTPVTSLRLAAETLRERFESLDEPSQRAAGLIFQETERLGRLIRATSSFLAASRKADPEGLRTLPSVNEFVEEICLGHEAAFVPLATDRALRTDPYWLQMCLENLLNNAFQHGRPPVTVSVTASGAFVVVAVSDTGVLDATVRAGLCRPFRKSPSSPGMGLGLSIVARKARDLGGRLEFSTNPTSFRIWLRNKS